MGRPSELVGTAQRLAGGGVGDVRIGGKCVAVSRGELLGWG